MHLVSIPMCGVTRSPFLHELSTDRDKFIKEELKLNLAEGKEIIHAVINGGSIPAEFSDNQFVKTYSAQAFGFAWWLFQHVQTCSKPST